MYAYWSELLVKFPKSQRYLLGQVCSQYLLQTLEAILNTAQTIGSAEKAKQLQIASTKLDLLKLLVRLAKDSRCISNTQYLQMESKLQETGRMLGGWIKSLN